MKSISILLLSLLNLTSGCGQILIPEWKVTVQVVDEANRPEPGADAEVWYSAPPRRGSSVGHDKVVGRTDTNGLFTASGRSQFDLVYSARKAGFYTSTKSLELGFTEKKRHEPWNPTLKLMLKKIGKPIPMYAKATRSNVGEAGRAFGYDLTVGDWVAPKGNGVSTDILFTAQLDKRAENDFDYKLVVSFPNQGDGIQPFSITELEKTSALRSPHEAPEGGYQPEWIKSQSRRPGEPAVNPLDESLNFFFRVRTVLDEKGNVKSALYGKIYGDFMNFRYYLNPEPNSRNMEFDPRRNLLKVPRGEPVVQDP